MKLPGIFGRAQPTPHDTTSNSNLLESHYFIYRSMLQLYPHTTGIRMQKKNWKREKAFHL